MTLEKLKKQRRNLSVSNNDAYLILNIVYRDHLETDPKILQSDGTKVAYYLRSAAVKMMNDNLVRECSRTEVKAEIGKYLALFIGKQLPYDVKNIESALLRHKKYMSEDTHDFYYDLYDESIELYLTRPAVDISTELAGVYIEICTKAQEIDEKVNKLWEYNFNLEQRIKTAERKLEALKHAYELNKASAAELNRKWQEQAEKGLKTYSEVNKHNKSKTNDKKIIFTRLIEDWRKTKRHERVENLRA